MPQERLLSVSKMVHIFWGSISKSEKEDGDKWLPTILGRLS